MRSKFSERGPRLNIKARLCKLDTVFRFCLTKGYRCAKLRVPFGTQPSEVQFLQKRSPVQCLTNMPVLLPWELSPF